MVTKLRILITLFTVMCLSLQAQDATKTVPQKYIDSLDNKMTEAFHLSMKGDFIKTIEIIEEILKNPVVKENYVLEGKAYNTIAIAFSNINQKDGLKYFIKGSEVYSKAKDTAKLIHSYNNIGQNLKFQNQIELSGVYFKKALDLTSDYKKYGSLVHPSYNYADYILETNGNLEESLKLLDSASHYLGDKINIGTQGEINKIYGKLYQKKEDYKLASDYFIKSSDIFKKIKYKQGVMELDTLQAALFYKQKDFEKGNQLLKNYIAVSDSVNKQRSNSIAKKIELEHILKDSEDELNFKIKEAEIKEALLKKTKLINTLLTILLVILVLLSYLIFKKNKALKTAKVKAENFSKSRSVFYSEVSHELRTPLYAVIELSKVLLKEDLDEKHQEYLRSLNFSGNHLLALIDNVLQLNDKESEKIKLQYVDFNLKELINSIVDSMEFSLNDTHNKIIVQYDSQIPDTIIGDPLRLAQVLINLVANAIKFTNNGTITIQVHNLKHTDNNIDLRFRISDTGKGISKEAQKSIFIDFYQEEPSALSDETIKSSGLGLSIVKRILEAFNSSIKIESEIGKGSEFSFVLNFKTKSSVKPIQEQLDAKLKSIAGSKFLIIDDNKINLLVTKKVLDQFGLESVLANSGAEGIEKVKQSHFDCILMDLHMPEMDGYEATDKIREFNKQIPIVALTAASVEDVENNISKHDMNGYVLKPFITSNFIDVISKAIVQVKSQTA